MKKIAILGLSMLLGISNVRAMDCVFACDRAREVRQKVSQEYVRPGITSLLPHGKYEICMTILYGLGCTASEPGIVPVAKGISGAILYNAGENGSLGAYVSTPDNSVAPQAANHAARYCGKALLEGFFGCSRLVLNDALVYTLRRVTGIQQFAAATGTEDGNVKHVARLTARAVDTFLPMITESFIVSPLMQGWQEAQGPTNSVQSQLVAHGTL